MTVDEHFEAALNELNQALRRDESTNLEPFLARVPEEDRAALFGELLAESLTIRSLRGESPWIVNYLTAEAGLYRKAVCRTLTNRLFCGDAAPARRLGVLEFGDYIASGVIGFGGFGTVLRGVHKRDREEVAAIKLAHTGMGRADVLLDNEAKSLQKAEGVQGVPRLIQGPRFTEDGRKYLVMGLIDGAPLDEWVASDAARRDRLSQLDVCRQVVRIVTELHVRGLIHSDVTPANVLVGGTAGAPRVKLVDFGNCNFGFQPNPLRIITSRYAAPELLLGTETQSSVATDGWSLGVIVHEVLGAYPFGDIPLHITDKQLGKHFASGRKASLPSDLPTELVQAVGHCMMVDPEARHLRMDLNALLDSITDSLAQAARPVLREPAPLSSPAPLSRAQLSHDGTIVAAIPSAPTSRGRVLRAKEVGLVAVIVIGLVLAAYYLPLIMAGGAHVAADEEKALARAIELNKEADEAPTAELTIEKSSELLKLIVEHEKSKNSRYADDWLERHRHTINRLGIAYRDLGRPDEAERQFTELLRLSPNPCRWRAVAFLELGAQSVERMSKLTGDARAAARAETIRLYRASIEVFRDPAVSQEESAAATEKRIAELEK